MIPPGAVTLGILAGGRGERFGGRDKAWIEHAGRPLLARAGDDGAFRRLVERHSRAVFQLAFRLTGSEPDAEDIVQDTFVKLLAQPEEVVEGHVAEWLFTVCRNRALDVLRNGSVSSTPKLPKPQPRGAVVDGKVQPKTETK